MTTLLYLIHAMSPVHCGTGQAISGIDLPIAREKPTGIPLIPGSSVKGVLRASSSGYSDSAGGSKDIHLAAFGPETANAADYAGAVQFSDANLVFLPMRSVRGTFSWVTSPYMLRRLARDAEEAGLDWKVPLDEPADDQCFVTGERLIVSSGQRKRVVLEDFDFAPEKSEALEIISRRFAENLYGPGQASDVEHFVKRVAVVPDDVMHVLSRVGMEVTSRNRVSNDTKTVADGALWTEEALPVESVLVGVLVTTVVHRGKLAHHDAGSLVEHVKTLCASGVQIGGKASVGRGLCRIRVLQ